MPKTPKENLDLPAKSENVQEVLPPESSLIPEPKNTAFIKTRERIKATLASVDRENKGVEGYSPLAQVWEEACSFTDTNQAILMNMQQNQVHIQDMEQFFWTRRQQQDRALAAVIEKGESGFQEYQDMSRRYADEQAQDRRSLKELLGVQQKLATEYRQCAMQKKWLIHIAQVKQFEMIVKAAIHRNVHDQATRNNIAEEIEEGVRNIFPIDAGANI